MAYVSRRSIFNLHLQSVECPGHLVKKCSIGRQVAEPVALNIFRAELNSNDNAQQSVEFADNSSIVQADQTTKTIVRLRRQPVPSTKSDFTEYLTHPVKIYHQTWDGTTTSALIAKDLIQLYYTSLPATLAKKLANLWYFRAQIHLTVTVQGAAQAYGQMVLAFTPNVSAPMEGTVTSTVALSQVHNVRIVPHITIDPSKNNTYELVLPVCTPTGFYQFINDAYNHGSYLAEMQVLNPLRSGTAVTPTVNVCVYASLDNPEFEGLTTLTSSGYVDEKLSSKVESVSYLSALAAPFSGVLEPGIMLFSEVTGVASKVLRWFGFSKPPQGDITALATTRTCDNYSQVEGISTAIVLGSSQKQCLSLDPSFAGGLMSDMSISYLCSQPSLIVKDLAIDTTFTSEEFITNVVVHPLVSLDAGKASPTAGIAIVSQFWAGDMSYLIEFIASPFTRCTVLIAWDPYATSATPPAFADALSILQNTTVQIVGNTTICLEVPYKNYMPVLSCSLTATPASGPNIPTTAGTIGCSNGMMYFYVINPVVDNGGSAIVAMNIWQSSKNIAFFGSTTENIPTSWVTSVTTLTSSGYVDEISPPTPISFGPSTNLVDLHKRVTGDPIKNVKDLTSRMDWVCSLSAGGATHVSVVAQVPNLPLANTTANIPAANTRFGWLASAFLGYRGSFRHSAYLLESIQTTSLFTGQPHCMVSHTISTAVDTPFVFTYVDSAGYVNKSNYVGLAWTQPNFEVTSRADITSPMMIGVDFLPTRAFPTTWKDVNNFTFTRSTNFPVDAEETVNITTGSGDDGMFMWFLGFPRTN